MSEAVLGNTSKYSGEDVNKATSESTLENIRECSSETVKKVMSDATLGNIGEYGGEAVNRAMSEGKFWGIIMCSSGAVNKTMSDATLWKTSVYSSEAVNKTLTKNHECILPRGNYPSHDRGKVGDNLHVLQRQR